jgi:hypothetical protein
VCLFDAARPAEAGTAIGVSCREAGQMAILIDFQNVREDSREVEYQFGLMDRMDRRLVFNKETRESRPVPGTPEGGYYTRVMLRILQFVETAQRWPEKGTYSA